ncbi:cytochrome c biogenesis protein [Geitlerinema sp. PCC 9228]|uniref:cytochrome c biogenesis protein n=1 Tax=Geitlerinema sp. PCC 9228 TaxID=111611 RepID=UPI0008F99A4E|nr:cytochrome c biogenesis protein [Geitlerinema sp. PCC 9228]
MTANNTTSFPDWIFVIPRFWKRELLPLLANLRLAIVLLLLIAVASMFGTVIEQGESVQFYQNNYPEEPAVFGFIDWKFILTLGLDRVYRTWWFLSLLVLFGSSLTACTFTRQFPALKAARRWQFYQEPRKFQKLSLSVSDTLQGIDALESHLQQRRYRVFREGDTIYARKGIVGRIGPIVVHASMLLILLGAILGNMTGVMAQQLIPSGETQSIDNIVDAGPWSQPQQLSQWSLQVNDFWIDYTPEGDIDQFYSDLSVLNSDGEPVANKQIKVNDPLRYAGFTVYQTDWSIDGIRVRVNNSPVFKLPMAKLKQPGEGRTWGTWIPIKPDFSEGISILAQDLQGTLVVYDKQGKLAGSVRVGKSIEVEGVTVKVLDLIGSTGLQIKTDPGIPLVYGGFALLMLGVVMSYVSHSQIWGLQQGDSFYLGGRTNRAQVAFEREFLEIWEQVRQKQNSSASA